MDAIVIIYSVKHLRDKEILKEEEKREVRKVGSGDGDGNTNSGDSGNDADEDGVF